MRDIRSPGRRRLAALAAAVAAKLTGFAMGGSPAGAAPQGEIRHAGGADAVAGGYIVVYRDGAGSAALTRRLAAAHGATVRHIYRAALSGFAASMSEAQARRLAANPAVAYVAQDHRVRIAAEQLNPPSWGLDRVEQGNLPLNSKYVYDTTASNVHVYVIDTGIRTSHTDFGGRASWAVNTTGDGINTDCNGHGTHVAGTAGGGKHGVAKAVRLHAVKVLNCSGSGSWSGVIAGVDWVTNNRIRPAVANMSLGGGANSAVDDAVRRSIASGVTYTIAAGNSNGNACNYTPARVGEALTVGNSTSSDSRSGSSNWGTCLDLFAPGTGITSAWHSSDTATNTISGTSMAAPHVAGAAALYLSGNTGASPRTVHDFVRFNATLDRLSNIGSGSPNRLLFSRNIAPRSGTNVLFEGGKLTTGKYLRSHRGNHELVMQGDGNLVHYQRGKALWASGTHNNPGAWAVMQHDGNFVVYSSAGRALWSTRTNGTAADRVVMQDDGNVVVYDSSGRAYWASR